MPRQRVYVGNLARDCRERDLEDFFHKYGRLNDVFTKGNGFAFVEFDDDRDADDAIHDLDGTSFLGSRVTIERARFPPGSRPGGDRDRGGYGGGGGGRGRSPPRRGGGGNLRFSPPHQTRHRIIIENLSTRYSWQDLKDMFRREDFDVTFADAHRTHQNEGVVCLREGRDIKRAIEKFQGKEINGREIKLIDDSGERSRSRSPRRGASRSRSPRSPRRKDSRSRSRDSRSKSKSGSRSPRRSTDDVKKERSASRSRSPSRSKSPTGADDKGKSKSRSRSRSATPEDKNDD